MGFDEFLRLHEHAVELVFVPDERLRGIGVFSFYRGRTESSISIQMPRVRFVLR